MSRGEGRGRAARAVDHAVGTNHSVVVPALAGGPVVVTTLVAGTLIHRLVRQHTHYRGRHLGLTLQ